MRRDWWVRLKQGWQTSGGCTVVCGGSVRACEPSAKHCSTHLRSELGITMLLLLLLLLLLPRGLRGMERGRGSGWAPNPAPLLCLLRRRVGQDSQHAQACTRTRTSSTHPVADRATTSLRSAIGLLAEGAAAAAPAGLVVGFRPMEEAIVP